MRLRILLLVLAIAALAATPAFAYLYVDCNGQPCEWGEYPISYFIRQPLGVNIDDAAAVEELRLAVERWNNGRQTFCEPLSFEYQGRRKTGNGFSQDHINLIFFETNNWPFGQDALALTMLWYTSAGELREADIGFNAIDFQWKTGPTASDSTVYGIRSTLTHEAGHFWGLDHSDNSFATMYEVYKRNILPEDLDEDDIRAAADRFCTGQMPSDDPLEQNDSPFYFTELDGVPGYSDLRLYDDDWFRVTLPAGKRVKLLVADNLTKRYKSLELYDVNGNLLDRQRCDGDCAQALGEAGEERRLALLIQGDFDNHPIESQLYGFEIQFVDPGQEGDLYDDEDGGGENSNPADRRGCGCSLSSGNGAADAALLGVLLGLLPLLRARRRSSS